MAESKRERAHEIAEQGLDKAIKGDQEAGKKLVDEARKIDPKAVEDLAAEVERDKADSQRFIEQK